MNPQGVRKPGWRAFEALNRAGVQRIPVKLLGKGRRDGEYESIYIFATVDDSKPARGLQLFVSNFGPMEGATGKAWNPVAKKVVINLGKDLSGKVASVTTIDDTTTNPYSAWVKMGSPQYPSQEQLQQLHTESEPLQTDATVDGNGDFTLTLQPYGVAHIAF